MKYETTSTKSPDQTTKSFGKHSSTGLIALLCLSLIVITLAVYMQVGNHEFLNLDDNSYVTDNPHVASGITGNNIIWAFTSVESYNWHPITWLSHMADVQFFGMNPRGHHLTNVAIHTISTILIFLLFVRMTSGMWQSFFIAALFALHPLHVESVAWVAERKDVLSALFWFLTLLLYAEYVAARKIWLYILVLFSFVLGLMSKPMLVTLPIVMLLFDYWPLNRYNKEQEPDLRQNNGRITALIIEKVPFFVCSLLSGLITIYAQQNGGAVASLTVVPFQLRIENALFAYIMYIGKTLWPHDLAIFYPYPSSVLLWQVISSLFVLLLISVAAIRTRRRHPYFAVGWLWFIITLLPVIGLLQVGGQSMADRYSYIPVTGLFIIAAWGVPAIIKGLQRRQSILAMFAGSVIVASVALTWQQLGYWQNNITLYRRTLKITTDNYVINNILGLAHQANGNLDEAIKEYREALRINPSLLGAHINLGIALQTKGKLDEAISEFQEALRISPNSMPAHYNLGIAYQAKGYISAAIQEYQTALRINPNFANTHNNLGTVLCIIGELDTAINEYREALRISPSDTRALYNLESTLAKKRVQDEASK